MVKKTLILALLIGVVTQGLFSSTANAACPVAVTTYGGASYSAQATTSGTFAVWTRMMVPDTTNKTFSLSVGDGLCNVTVGNGDIAPNQWVWVNYRDGNTASKINATLATGTHTVQLGGTKPGVKVDKIMLVQDVNCTPVNDGSNCVVSPDTTAPSAPASLTSPSQTLDSISLSWGNSTDNIGVVRYDVYRGATKVGSSTVNSYTDSNLLADTAYSYSVKAADAAGNVSAASNILQTRTKVVADTTPPVSALVTPKTGDTLSNTVTLTATATDNRSISNVKFYIDDYTLLGTVSVSPYSLTLDTTKYVNGAHRIHAVASDSSGNASSTPSASVTISNVFPDTTAPTVPANLVVGTRTQSSVALSWTASTDNTGVTGYEIYRNGAKVATVTSVQYVDQFLTASTSYSYYVRAIDAAGNASGTSTTVQATTLESPDTTAPSVTLTAPVAGNVSGIVAMTAQASDNRAVAFVDFYANGYLIGRDSVAPYSINWATTLAPNSTVPVTAVATDTSNNSTTSPVVTVTINNVTPDTTAPSVPVNLLATAVSTSQINLSWAASTDNIGVVGYEVYRNSAKVATVTTPSYGDTGLSAGTTYTYSVKALDAAGNASANSVAASAVTQVPPPPSVQFGGVQGTIRNSSASPIKGAKVSYISNGYRLTVQSNRQGYYSVANLPYSTINFTYTARSYSPLTKSTLINAQLVTQDVTLQKGN